MGRTYAGILGPMAFAIVVARGLSRGADAEATLQTASLALVAFAAAGLVIGSLAQWIVDESVREKAEKELADLEGNRQEQRDPATAR